MTSERDPAFEELLEFLRERRGFDYTEYKRPSLMRRFRKRMGEVGVGSFEEYRRRLEEEPREVEQLFETICINVTSFFRDPPAWDFVAEEILPRVIGSRREGEPIRVWSAGCASGEEAYTIAILLCEALGDDAYRERAKVYATDVDEDALGAGRRAVYAESKLENVSEERRERFFRRENGAFAVRGDVRRSVVFGRNDLLQDPPISRVDLLVSRNTLMYFDPDAQRRILSNFYFALNRDGILLLGKAEALQSRTDLFVAHDLKRRVFVKNHDYDGLRPAMRPIPLGDEGGAHREQALPEAAFEQAPVAELVVDLDGRLAAANRPARSLFGIRGSDVGRPLQDLEVSYRPVELRSLIDRVRSSREPTSSDGVEWSLPDGERRQLDVLVAPLRVGGDDVSAVTVTFSDVTRYRALQDDLEQARRDLETAYEELQSTVEELETTNEELQSTNEELETTNEELQSTNEELETMNEELQSTNEELETMNDELRDRTDEALRANDFLSAVLGSIPQAVVVVDAQLTVSAWGRSAVELWGLREDEVVGQHLLNLEVGVPLGELRGPVRKVLEGGDAEPVVLRGHNRRGQPVECTFRIEALRSQGGDVRGAIVVVGAERVEE